MCLAVPGKVVKIDGRQAVIQYPQGLKPAFIGDTPAKVGDYVMVQMGIIIQVLTPADAKVSMTAWA